MVTSTTGTPLAGARIGAYQNGVGVASAVTNSRGGYSIVLPGPGHYTIIVSAAGYTPQTSTIDIAIGERLVQDYALVKFSGNPITLSDAGVNPGSGTTADTFTFSVTYKHLWGKMPRKTKVIINGSSKTMILVSGDSFFGAVYQYTTKLPARTNKYYFSFGDGTKTKRMPTSGSFIGPVVFTPSRESGWF